MFSDLQEKIKTLTETTWKDRDLDWSEVKSWLGQFNALRDEEKLQLLFVLSNFMYFGRREMREMLKSLYRDIYKYPLVSEIRKSHADTKDRNLLESEFLIKLSNTRFLGIGNPSESGTHLLYFFRQENNLSKNLFINGHEIFSRDPATQEVVIKDKDIERYIFIDDLTCSGTQAITYSNTLVKDIKSKNPKAIVCYYVLFATDEAIERIKAATAFDDVKGLFELDQSFKCFEANSRYYKSAPTPIDRRLAKNLCQQYDNPLSKALCEKDKHLAGDEYILGFDASQLLLAFYHNTPDNSPPVFWYDGEYEGNKQWHPIFERYHKVYNGS